MKSLIQILKKCEWCGKEFAAYKCSNMLGHITVNTVYAKMTTDYGDYTIPLIPREEALC